MDKKLVLNFPPSLVDKPIISCLVKEFGLDFNILKAYVTPEEEGTLVLELKGEEEKITGAIAYLKQLGVKVELLSKEVEMVRERCTDCTACIPQCPAGALWLDQATYQVNFTSEKCIACGICLKACPTKAMVLRI
ncbi:MAG TPA: NIL domain-containing protein [bacterium]|nr:NIL domain-containing protein [bacterium]HOL67282.1 NIL domain-containing protein [bacterium]HPP11147.1 NIL domain-containing protein [bacterium]